MAGGLFKGMTGGQALGFGSGMLGMGMDMAFKKQAMDLDLKQNQMKFAFEKQKFDLLKSIQQQQLKNDQARVKIQQDKLKWQQEELDRERKQAEGEKEGPKSAFERYISVRRYCRPDDIAALLVYLASDASSFDTGQTYYVSGGVMAHG